MRILDGSTQKRFHRDERLIRVVHQLVLIPQLVEDDFRVLIGAPQGWRRERRVLELRPVSGRELHPVAEAEARVCSLHEIFGHLEVLDEDVEHARGHVRAHLQQRHRSTAKLPEARFNGLQKVVSFGLLDLEVRVPDDAEQVSAFDLRARKELLNICPNHVLDEDKRSSLRCRELFGKHDEARKHVGHFDSREFRASGMADHHREVLAQVGDERKRVARIEGERRQNGTDLTREVGVKMFANLRRPVLRLAEHDLLGRQKRPQLFPALSEVVQHLHTAAAHRGELLQRVEAVRCDVFDSLPQILLRRRDANHEELVEIRRGNREEFHSFEQRMRRIEGLVEDALIELEPAQLAVDVERRVLEIPGIKGPWLHDAECGTRRLGISSLSAPPAFCHSDVSRAVHTISPRKSAILAQPCKRPKFVQISRLQKSRNNTT